MTAPRKDPGGLSQVLFTRVNSRLHDALTAMLEQRNAKLRGSTLSMSDLVRGILWEAVEPIETPRSQGVVEKGA